MRRNRRSIWSRGALVAMASGLVLLLAGDRPARTALIGGIDPLEVMDLQVRNNVLFVFDTSGSMKWPLDINNFSVGGDDTQSRMWQAKQAVKAVVNAHRGSLNFGLASYNRLTDQKPLNRRGWENFDGDGRTDGPLVYVSVDAEANIFYLDALGQQYICPGTTSTRPGFFCRYAFDDDSYGRYDGTTSREIFRSFANGNDGSDNFVWNRPYDPPEDPPVACTDGVDCRYYMQSKLFRNGFMYNWNLNTTNEDQVLVGAPTPIVCPAPPSGAFSNNDPTRPCFQFRDDATGAIATFYFSSAIFDMGGGTSCDGIARVADVYDGPCDDLAAQELVVREILDSMELEVPMATLNAEFVQGANLQAGFYPTVAGLRAGQGTPLAASLDDVRNDQVFPTPAGGQKNFVILLTDGDDTCASDDGDTAAYRAAQAADNLLGNGVPAEGQAETMVIAFTSAVNADRANWIARGGSGGVPSGGTYVCPAASTTCRDAFFATSLDELIEALNAALEVTFASGELAAAASTVATVFELGPIGNDSGCVRSSDPNPNGDPLCVDPLDPNTRYNRRAGVFYQPTFELPAFEGHLKAFARYGTPTYDPITGKVEPIWDAADVLSTTVTLDSTGTAFDALPALIPRRVFTSDPTPALADPAFSPVNISYQEPIDSSYTAYTPRASWDAGSAAGNNVVALWPPDQSGLGNGIGDIDPGVGLPGPLDDVLGVGNIDPETGFAWTLDPGTGAPWADPTEGPRRRLAFLRRAFGACKGSVDNVGTLGTAVPALCDPAVTPLAANRLPTAVKEARQILLAYTAGAKLELSATDQLPLRDNAGELLYVERDWLLADSTATQPTVVTPPLRSTPGIDIAEFLLFRDGRRNANRQGVDDLDEGFGLRNPDYDNYNPANDLGLKPRMTVVYVAANDGLHAFRAGPNCGSWTTLHAPEFSDIASCSELGGEELWNFVPYDQLGKLRLRMVPQSRADHTYMLASSVRVVDIFVPEEFDRGGVTFAGRWRTMIVFGRGPGGKFYTALDITAPGSFTRDALDSNPPWVMWNHGNEDPDPATGVDPVTDDDYDGMGQTWAVPAAGNILPRDDDGDDVYDNLPEWRLWVGSGYSDQPGEGTTFYQLDAITGDVLDTDVVPDGGGTYPAANALVASPSAFNPRLMKRPDTPFYGADQVERVYQPDLHGRIWKFDMVSGTAPRALERGQVADLGDGQPFGSAVALLSLPPTYVYAEAGNDNRWDYDPVEPFRLYAFEDASSIGAFGTLAFTEPLVDSNNNLYRGTVQPATVFNPNGKARAFFLGTRFECDPPPGRFDSIFFALLGITGGAAYDFGGDGTADISTVITGTRAVGIQPGGGQVIISDSGGLGDPPDPPLPPASLPEPAGPEPAKVETKS